MNFCIGYHDNLSTMICQFIFSIFSLPVSSDTAYTTVIHIAYFNTTARCACMHNLSVTDINTHMTVITDHIPREHLRLADCTSASCQGVGITGWKYHMPNGSDEQNRNSPFRWSGCFLHIHKDCRHNGVLWMRWKNHRLLLIPLLSYRNS